MDPTLKYGLIGAGAGAGLGAAANLLVGDKKKDKVKQALKGIMVGGALGGAAGAGLGYFKDSLGLDFLKDKKEGAESPKSIAEKLKGDSETYTEPEYLKTMNNRKTTVENELTEQHKALATEMANDPDFVNQIEKYGWEKKNLEDLKYDQDKQWYDIWESDEEKFLRSKAGNAYLNWRKSGKTLKDLLRASSYLNRIY